MADQGLATHVVKYEFSHPAWTPEDASGTAITGMMAGDAQEFTVTGLGIKLSGGFGPEEVFEDRSGDTDSGQVMAPTSFRNASNITVVYTQISSGVGKYFSKFLDTVKNDATRRAGTLLVTWATGDTNTISFGVAKNDPVPVSGGSVTGAADLVNMTPPVEARA